jgi:hypothetical protein
MLRHLKMQQPVNWFEDFFFNFISNRAAAIPWENRGFSQLERQKQLIELYSGVPRELLLRVYRHVGQIFINFPAKFSSQIFAANFLLTRVD